MAAAIFAIVFWLTWQLLDYEELGDYLVRLGLGWLFLTFLSFVAFSAVVSALSTFFLSEDLRLLLAAPVPAERLFHSRFARDGRPVRLDGRGLPAPRPARPRPRPLRAARLLPARGRHRRALRRDPVRPRRDGHPRPGERLPRPARARRPDADGPALRGRASCSCSASSGPSGCSTSSPCPTSPPSSPPCSPRVTPFLPSFWAGESLFAALRGQADWLHLGALWTTALALTVLARAAYGRHYFAAWSKAQEARKARFTRLSLLEPLVRRLPLSPARRALLVKDLKVFLRDTTQWSQLLLLLALALVYVYNFRVLDLDRIPYMSRVIKNAYAFVNLAMAAFVTAAVAVRFVFPAVSAEGPAFWIVRTAPVRMSSFLWSKLWTGLVPILVLAEALTVASNHLLGVPPFLKVLGAGAIAFMTVALVGLACGMGARHPRFGAENLTQVAGSYGGVAFMVLAVLYILATVALLAWPASLYLWHEYRGLPIAPRRQAVDGAVAPGGRGPQPRHLLGLDEERRPGPRGARLAPATRVGCAGHEPCYDRRSR